MKRKISRFLKKYFFFVLFFSIIFSIGGVVFEFLLIPALVMISSNAGYQFPTMERFFFMAKFVILVSPICAAAVSIFLRI